MSDERALLAAGLLFFLASAAGIVVWCRSMSGGMPMPGGWTMSMAWMKMPGQTWLGASATFLGMWMVMMAAMMAPSLLPNLVSFRVGTRQPGSPAGRAALAAAGYFSIWTAVGAAVYPLGVTLAQAEMRWELLARSVPLATGAVLLAAGGLQLTAWKGRHLVCCRPVPDAREPGRRAAWRYGLRLGVHCTLCCSGFIAVLLAAGVMDLRAMALVATGITAERLAPRPARVARLTGLVLIAMGLYASGRALGVG